jgi:hypothetical protein
MLNEFILQSYHSVKHDFALGQIANNREGTFKAKDDLSLSLIRDTLKGAMDL